MSYSLISLLLCTRHCVRHRGAAQVTQPCSPPSWDSVQLGKYRSTRLCGVWYQLGAGRAGHGPHLTAHHQSPVVNPQSLLYGLFGNLRHQTNRLLACNLSLSHSPSRDLLSQLVLISSGSGPNRSALVIMQELGDQQAGRDGDSCLLATVSGLCGPGLLGTGSLRIFASCRMYWALSILGRWCSHSLVKGLVFCGRTGDEVGWRPPRLGSGTRPSNWISSFQWSN